MAVQNVLEVLSAAGKLGVAVTFAYRDQVQRLLDRGHSLAVVVGLHEEFLMHLCRQDSFDLAGDSILGKSVFQSLCTDLPPVSAQHYQQSFRGGSSRGARRGSFRGDRPPPKDGCYVCSSSHFASDCPDRKSTQRGHSFRGGSHGNKSGNQSFLERLAPGSGENGAVRT